MMPAGGEGVIGLARAGSSWTKADHARSFAHLSILSGARFSSDAGLHEIRNDLLAVRKSNPGSGRSLVGRTAKFARGRPGPQRTMRSRKS